MNDAKFLDTDNEYSDHCADAEADLSSLWAHMSEEGYVFLRFGSNYMLGHIKRQTIRTLYCDFSCVWLIHFNSFGAKYQTTFIVCIF